MLRFGWRLYYITKMYVNIITLQTSQTVILARGNKKGQQSVVVKDKHANAFFSQFAMSKSIKTITWR